MSLLLLLSSAALQDATVVSPAASGSVSASGSVLVAVVAPVPGVSASAVASGSSMVVAVPVASVTASASGSVLVAVVSPASVATTFTAAGLGGVNTFGSVYFGQAYPSAVGGGSSVLVAITVVVPLTLATASRGTTVPQETFVTTAASAVAAAVAPALVVTKTVVSPAATATASVTGTGVMVTALVIPAAVAIAAMFRLGSPTGQQESPYINVTLRQLV